MKILGNRVLVEPVEKVKKEGEFEKVDVHNDFDFKGRIVQLSCEEPICDVKVGEVIIYAKYSPDTHEIDHEGKKYRSVLATDIIAVL